MLKFKVKQFNDEEKFLNYLRPSKNHWEPFNPKKWLFRGMSNPLNNGKSAWLLTPSAWREGTLQDRFYGTEKYKPHLRQMLKGSSYEDVWQNVFNLIQHVSVEYIRINRFAKLADSIGFHMPRFDEWMSLADDFSLRYAKHLIETEDTYKVWNHPIVALAQHHGVPTRLLDWTENPLVAVYFAIMSYERSNENLKRATKNIVVYAIHESILGENIQKVVVSKSENQNLRMQKGLFLLNKTADNTYIRDSYPHFPTFNETFSQMQRYTDSPEHPYLKLQLSTQLTENGIMYFDVLKDLLKGEDITAYHLMPSLDNVARAIIPNLR